VVDVLAEELVRAADAEDVLLGHVDVVDHEGHLHVRVEVDQLFAHFGVHVGHVGVQPVAVEAVLQFELVRQLGFVQELHGLRDRDGLGVGVRPDHEQILGFVRGGVERHVDEVDQVLGVLGRQDDFVQVHEVLQEGFRGHVVHALELALVVEHELVLDRALREAMRS